MTFESEISKLPAEIVEALKNTPQSPKYHPEGVVYNHIKLVWECAVKKSKDLAICAIFHDLGKIDSTTNINGKIQSIGHEHFAKKYLDKYLDRFDYDNKELIYAVCANHMKAHQLPKMRTSKQELFKANPYYYDIMQFEECDRMTGIILQYDSVWKDAEGNKEL